LLNSLAARASLDVWRMITRSPAEAFSETAARLPHFLAGIGTIFLMFLLGRAVGSPLAGASAAWLPALHPWHVRSSAVMRGRAHSAAGSSACGHSRWALRRRAGDLMAPRDGRAAHRDRAGDCRIAESRSKPAAGIAHDGVVSHLCAASGRARRLPHAGVHW